MTRNFIENGGLGRIARFGRNAALMGSLAFAGGVAAEVATQDQSPQSVALAVETTGTPDRTISCRRVDRWYPLRQDETVRLRTNGAIAIADVTVGGKFQSDDDGNTATELLFKDSDNSKKTVESWTVFVNFPGSILVPSCDVSDKRLDQLAGRWLRKTDIGLGKNDPVKRVNGQVLTK